MGRPCRSTTPLRASALVRIAGRAREDDETTLSTHRTRHRCRDGAAGLTVGDRRLHGDGDLVDVAGTLRVADLQLDLAAVLAEGGLAGDLSELVGRALIAALLAVDEPGDLQAPRAGGWSRPPGPEGTGPPRPRPRPRQRGERILASGSELYLVMPASEQAIATVATSGVRDRIQDPETGVDGRGAWVRGQA